MQIYTRGFVSLLTMTRATFTFVLFLFFSHFLNAEQPILVHFNQLKELAPQEDSKYKEIRIRGFLYQSCKGEWILAEEPNLKTCCIGSSKKADTQIHLNKEFEGVVSSQPVLVKGHFFTEVSGNASLSPLYRIEKAEVTSEEKKQSSCEMTLLFLALSALVSYIGLSYFFRTKGLRIL